MHIVEEEHANDSLSNTVISAYDNDLFWKMEELARSTLDALSLHIAILDQAGTIIAVNRAWREFARANGAVDKKVSEGANYLAICDSAQNERSAAATFAAGIRVVIAGKQERYAAEYPCDSPDEKRWFIGSVTRFFGFRAVHVMVAHENITERKQIEEALSESEEQYRLLFEDNPCPMWVYHLGTLAFLAVNDAAIEHYGYSRREFLGMTIKDLRPQEEIQALLEDVRLACLGRSKTGIWRHRKKDGSLIDVEITARTVNLKDERARLVLALDITERRRAEAELRQSEERYRRLFEALPDMIYTLSAADGTITTISPACKTLTGWRPADVIGKHFTTLTHPDDVKIVEAIFQHVLQGESPAPYEVRILTSSGDRFVAEIVSIPQIENGKVTGLLGIARDITERKCAEEEIRHLNLELEQRVIQRTAQLAAANHEMEAFSYSVSHDLRAPLRAIAGFSRILREDYITELPDEARQYLQRVQDNAQQMGRLIDDLLAFSRLGRRDLNKQSVALGQMARTVMEDLHGEYEHRQVKVTIGELPVCQADPTLLKQVFANLLANALKFTRQRAMALIEIGYRQDGDNTVYFVKDNGVGFDMRYVHKLFGVFQRLHRAEDYEGTGVGLATVQRIINRHGGRIWAEAEIGKGATFFFTLGKETND
ncbi:MAG: PAS domain S-box protein [Acidobacteriota bacterium]